MKRYILAIGLLAVALPAIAAEIGNLDAVDAANTGRFPENMSPGAVNDSARALEGILARAWGDESCVIVSTGTSSAFSVSATRTLTAYYDGLKVCFDAHSDNDGPVTLNVDSLGAASVVTSDGQPLSAGQIVTGQKVEVVYDGANWQILGSDASTSQSKAWVYARIASSAVSDYTGQNVASFSREATGQFSLEFDSNFSAARYACVVTPESTTGVNLSAQMSPITAGAAPFNVRNGSNAIADPDGVSVICFGDQ